MTSPDIPCAVTGADGSSMTAAQATAQLKLVIDLIMVSSPSPLVLFVLLSNACRSSASARNQENA
jgi:hypothetical protein